MRDVPKVHQLHGIEVYGHQIEPGDLLEVGDRIANRVKWLLCGESLAGSVMKDEASLLAVRPLPVATFPPQTPVAVTLRRSDREVYQDVAVCLREAKALLDTLPI